MKKIVTLAIATLTLLCGGCSSTTITEYDSLGNVIKVTKTSENAMYIGAQSLQKKDNFFSVNGWCLGANPSANIYGAGSFSMVAGSINKDNGATNALAYGTMISNAKVSLNISADKDGIKAKAETNETSEQAHPQKESEQ